MQVLWGLHLFLNKIIRLASTEVEHGKTLLYSLGVLIYLFFTSEVMVIVYGTPAL